MAKNEVLGTCKCPLCLYEGQEVRESANGKPYLICEECGCQLFARQARSVKLLLAMAKGAPVEKSPEPEPEPEPEPQKPPVKVEIPKPAPDSLDALLWGNREGAL